MTSENKNGGDSWGTLYGRPVERLAFHYGRHKEATRYALKSYRYYHTMAMYVICLPFTNFGWLRFSRCHRLQFNAKYASRYKYTDILTLSLANYFRFHSFLH